MLTGRLPYGAQTARTRTRSQQRNLQYAAALDDNKEMPAWIDVLKKAAHPDPYKRCEALSEFVHDLRHPNADFITASPSRRTSAIRGCSGKGCRGCLS